jgi:hypothetical protein
MENTSHVHVLEEGTLSKISLALKDICRFNAMPMKMIMGRKKSGKQFYLQYTQKKIKTVI